ncbi:acetylxylan esterase [candidate division KSB1 bacterium]|nr:acetylxylan esterase [candidate division KSB1 bacterium]
MNCFFCLAFILFCSILHSQPLPIQTTPALDQSNNIRGHLMRVASEITRHSFADITSLATWQERRPTRYDQMIEMLGLVDVPLREERPPLNVTLVDTIQQPGFRIIKLYYESLPQLYVPADLYIPDDITAPRPAILYVCGHARTQKVHYQPHARRFAQLGFVCLIIETIQWGEVRGEHWGCYANGWFHWYSRGYNPGGVEAWNGIRGLDLLCERPEIDADKLGVTGISGGGAQSWYIAAIDPRIKAVAPVCGASNCEAHIHTRTIDGHCDCMVPTNIYGWDFPDIGALIAPRPLLIGQADRDGLNTIESVRDITFRIKSIYDLYDAAESIELVETPGGHSYHKTSRQKIFAFFLKHLMNKRVDYAELADIDDSEQSQLSEEALRVYIDGPPADDRTRTIQDSFIRLPQAPVIGSVAELASHRQRTVDRLRAKTFHAFPSPVPLSPRYEFRTLDSAPYGRSVYTFVAERDWRLKVDIRWKNPQDARSPLMLVLRSPDEKRWESEEFISGLHDSWNIAYFETRGVGESGWSPELQWHVRRAAAWTGRTVASMRVYDALRCIEFLKTVPGVDAERIGLAARGEMTVIALYAALLDGGCAALLLKNPPPSQDIASQPDGRGPAIEMLGCLQITDVYQIPGLLFPTPISFVGSVAAEFDWSRELYQRLGGATSFRCMETIADF